MQRALSAGGKLFLSGEYAVLWGGTARIACVAPRTQAIVQRRSDREVHILLEGGSLRGHATPLGVRWEREVPADYHFVARTVDEALRAHGRESLGFDLAFESSPTDARGRKLGLGGSARACVLAAEATRFILEDKFDALKLALLAHGKAQDGKGSGGDVAAIFAGGIVRYRRFAIDALMEASGTGRLLEALARTPPVDLWRLPAPKVHLGYAFTNQSASTRLLIAEVEARLGASGREAFVSKSDSLGQELEETLLKGDFVGMSSCVGELQALLASLGPLETEPMRQLLSLARTTGAVGKMSGAGGGDGCILFAPDPDVLAWTLETLGERGFHGFALELQPGVRGEAVVAPALTGWLNGR